MSNASGQLPRLIATCAEYRRRYGSWPNQLRLGPMHLHVLINGLSLSEFEQLVERIPLIRTSADEQDPGPSVGGRGVVRYMDLDGHGPPEDIEMAWAWLGIRDG